MSETWQQFAADWPQAAQGLVVAVRLLLAAVVGALPGLEREREDEDAGLRTHILVAVGAAVFVLLAVESGIQPADMAHVIQGVATGIGFVGAGAILKMTNEKHVRGLTTASGIWLTAGLGTAVGLGHIWLAFCGSVLAVFVLSYVKWLKQRAKTRPSS